MVKKKIIIFLILLFPVILFASQDLDQVNKGKELLKEHKFSRAVTLFQKVCITSPSAESWNLLGISFTAQGNYGRAVGAFNKALMLDSSSSRIYSNLALAYFYLKDSSLARKNYELAIDADPGNPVARMNYAVFLTRLKEYNMAEALLKEALAVKSSLFFARLYLGYIYYSQKKYRQALQEFSRGIQINDKSFDLFLYRANTYYRLNILGAAENDLLKAELLRPHHPKVGILKRLINRRRKIGR